MGKARKQPVILLGELMSKDLSFSQKRVFISGLTAAGKTTHSKLLSTQFGLTYISASIELLGSLGIKDETISDKFWASKQGKDLEDLRKENRSYDKEIDQKMVMAIETKDNLVIDSWGCPWLSKKDGMRIWLESSLTSRIWKSMISHGLPADQTYQDYISLLTKKDENTRNYFWEEYRFDIYKDYDEFDLVLDISSFIKEPSFEASLQSISCVADIIQPFVAFYLYGSIDSADSIKKIYNMYGQEIIKKMQKII